MKQKLIEINKYDEKVYSINVLNKLKKEFNILPSFTEVPGDDNLGDKKNLGNNSIGDGTKY